jgi:hypothetical protein
VVTGNETGAGRLEQSGPWQGLGAELLLGSGCEGWPGDSGLDAGLAEEDSVVSWLCRFMLT